MKGNPTKQKVINAASSLFYQRGFDGTSVRDIATKADVNVSLISYYFKGKQGLLEHAVTNYYESYLHIMDETVSLYEKETPLECLVNLVYNMLYFRMEHYQLSAFIHRELTLDSTFVREMAVTYLAKENHLLSSVFFSLLSEKKKQHRQILYIQLKGMLMSPFTMKVEWDTSMLDSVGRLQFAEQYTKVIKDWLDYLAKN